MKSIKELKEAISNNIPLVWNDPDPIKGNDYTISYIGDIDDDFDEYTPILIQYLPEGKFKFKNTLTDN